MQYMENWEEHYADKCVSPKQAIELIEPGDRVFVDSGCAEPTLLTRALFEAKKAVADTEILHLFTIDDETQFSEARYFESMYRHNTFFIGEDLRRAVWEGVADYTPVPLSGIPPLFHSGRVPVDVALVQVTPPNADGYCSLGVNVDVVKAVAATARRVIAEVNPHMPWTRGDSLVHVDDLARCVVASHPLLEFQYDPPDEVARQIAHHLSELILDGSTLQLGIGQVPNAIPALLEDKKDLGVHSEVFSDSIVDLVDAGIVTGARKTLHPGKIVTSFVMGSRRLFDFVDDNPAVEFHPVEHVNDPNVIARNYRQVSINAALTVDLTGQVNSDSLGYRFYSGIGGQVDFHRGAALAPEGRPIITLPSTTDDGTQSRVVPLLKPGAGVTINRGEIHYVVTEWGWAYLHGKNIRDRALAMISIAHPKFRERLLDLAKKMHYVFADQRLPVDDQGNVVLYPERFETWRTFRDDQRLFFRPVKITDERAIQELVYDLDERSRYYRFFTTVRFFGHEKAQKYVITNYEDDFILVGFDKDPRDPSRQELVAVAAYYREKNTNLAEISMMVAEDYREIGIATFLLQYLERVARENRIAGFTGEVLLENRQMIRLIKRVPHPVESHWEDGVWAFEYRFIEAKAKAKSKAQSKAKTNGDA